MSLTSEQPLAFTRGENWGLPGGGGATGFTRPLRVGVYADQLVLYPSQRGDDAEVVRFAGATREGVEEFVSRVQRRIESWGIAGPPGAYWKPVLRVEVGRGGEQRFTDLETLLRGSGIVVERKSS